MGYDIYWTWHQISGNWYVTGQTSFTRFIDDRSQQINRINVRTRRQLSTVLRKSHLQWHSQGLMWLNLNQLEETTTSKANSAYFFFQTFIQKAIYRCDSFHAASACSLLLHLPTLSSFWPAQADFTAQKKVTLLVATHNFDRCLQWVSWASVRRVARRRRGRACHCWCWLAQRSPC